MFLTMTVFTSRYLVFLFVLLTIFLSCNRKDIYSLFKGKKAVSLSISPMEKVVSSGLTVQYRAMAYLEDGSSLDVTDDSSWTVSTLSGDGASPGTSPGSVIAGVSSGTASVRASCRDLTSGEATLTVFSGTSALFVSPLGSNSNTGTSDSPFLTVDHAITVANAMAPIAIVIAEGDYSTTGLSLTVDGVSLYGGFDANWSSDDFENSRARIKDSSTSGGDNCCANNVKAAILFGSAITNATVIQGLDISGSTESGMSFPAAIDTGDGSPVIRYCIIRGGYGTYRSNGILLGNTATLSSPRITSTQILGGSAPGSTAIRLRGNCAAVITGCFIFGGTGTTTNTGIFMGNSPSASFIYNNVIACGYTSSAANSYGIESQYANNFISNNTILAGSFSGDAAGICTSYTSKPYINNNIFYLTAGASRYGIYEEGYTTNDPTEVMNNLFF
jgi:hypothetical protein